MYYAKQVVITGDDCQQGDTWGLPWFFPSPGSLRTNSRALRSFSALLLWRKGIRDACVEFFPADRTRLGRSRQLLYSAIRLLWSGRVCRTHRLPALGNSVLWKHTAATNVTTIMHFTLYYKRRGTRRSGQLGTREEGRHHNKTPPDAVLRCGL